MATFIAISNVNNGVRIAITYEDGEKQEYVIQELDDERSSVEAWRQAFSTIFDDYGPAVGRHSDARLYFVVAPGDKHEDFEDTIYQ